MSDRVLQISVGQLVITATLNDSATSDQLWDALPITGRANIWGDEIYFSIPVDADEAVDALETVDMGSVAYWPPGNALCLFWGPTPMSAPGEIRPASAVNVMGVIDGDPTVLVQVSDGAEVLVERAD
ncbi:uncharacterized protein METZ01_LOCUS484198 [marine metagenome]|uniref:Cyclophilin TM1367-like domain-containing protein n=1 Tax=marine metagenome TaxID=408172 RepID=A0A383CGV6_9ZZZZ